MARSRIINFDKAGITKEEDKTIFLNYMEELIAIAVETIMNEKNIVDA